MAYGWIRIKGRKQRVDERKYYINLKIDLQADMAGVDYEDMIDRGRMEGIRLDLAIGNSVL